MLVFAALLTMLTKYGKKERETAKAALKPYAMKMQPEKPSAENGYTGRDRTLIETICKGSRNHDRDNFMGCGRNVTGF